MKIDFVLIELIFLFVIGFNSCKIAANNKVKNVEISNQNNTSNSQPTVYPTEPGTCVVQAYIINILPSNPTIQDEPCSSFPCVANIIITKSSACGFGVHKKPMIGDTLQVNFIYTLAPSEQIKNVYPVKVNLPGLKQDQLFDAQIRIKLLPMDKLTYEIGNYDLVR